jgi:hypothetical protein
VAVDFLRITYYDQYQFMIVLRRDKAEIEGEAVGFCDPF